MRMNSFEAFIYMLGAVTFSIMIAGSALYLVHLIEKPVRSRK